MVTPAARPGEREGRPSRVVVDGTGLTASSAGGSAVTSSSRRGRGMHVCALACKLGAVLPLSSSIVILPN